MCIFYAIFHGFSAALNITNILSAIYSKERHSCSIIGGLAEGYKTTCKQKYVYRQLASVQTDGKIVPDTFRFPSSCCCHVSFNGNTFARMGVNIVEQKSQITPIKTRKRK